MNYYDESLMRALSVKGISSYVFSNFIGSLNIKTQYYNYYDSFKNKNHLVGKFSFLKAILKTALKLRKNQVDLVITHYFEAVMATFLIIVILKLFNQKIAAIIHDISSFRKNDKKIYKYIIYNYLTDFLIVHNQFSYKSLLKTSTIKNRDKIHIIKHGGYLDFIDNNTETQKNVKPLIKLNVSKKYILFFGQIKEVKGLKLLLDAMTNIDRNVHLIIAGKSTLDDYNPYAGLITKYNLTQRVHHINRYIYHNEIAELFKCTQMIILPYKRVYQSGVLLMAMSYKLPLLASNLLPITEIIKHKENGLLFKKDDVKDLANKINQCVNNDALLMEISDNAFKTIKNHYSWDDIADKYIELLKSTYS